MPPSLHLEAGKEGMTHLLFRSYVQKPDSVFFSLNGREAIWLRFWSVVTFQQDYQPEACQKPNGADKASFCKDKFSFVLDEAPTNFNYNFQKAECCSGEDLLVIISAGSVLENHNRQTHWNVSELFKKWKRRYISSLNSWVALDRALELSLAFCRSTTVPLRTKRT